MVRSSMEAVELGVLAPESAPRGILWISIQGDDGRSGHGEIAHRSGRLELARTMAGAVIGRDPFDLQRLRAAWSGIDASATELRAVAAGIETALVDLQGQLLDRPLFDMLGGRHTSEVPIAVRLDPGADQATAVERADDLLSKGFETLVIESSGDAGDDLRLVQALRDRFGPEPNLRLDLGARPAPAAIRSLLDGLAESNLEMVIDPAHHVAACQMLRENAPAPVALCRAAGGVEELASAIQADALDVWIADPLAAGGPAAMVRAAAVAKTFAIDVALQAREASELGAALALHLASAQRVVNRALELSPHLLRGDGIVADGLRIENGRCRVSDGPGLGIQPDPEKPRAHRSEHVVVDRPTRAAKVRP